MSVIINYHFTKKFKCIYIKDQYSLNITNKKQMKESKMLLDLQ